MYCCCSFCSFVPRNADLQREAAHDAGSEHVRLSSTQSQQPQPAHAQPARLHRQHQPRALHPQRLPHLQWRLERTWRLERIRLRLSALHEHLQLVVTGRCVSDVTPASGEGLLGLLWYIAVLLSTCLPSRMLYTFIAFVVCACFVSYRHVQIRVYVNLVDFVF